MKKFVILTGVLFIALSVVSDLEAGGETGSLGIGFRAGLNRLEGDAPTPVLSPFILGDLRINVVEYFSIGVEGGYGALKLGDINVEYLTGQKPYRTSVMPFELDFTFHFLPLSKIIPYASIGGGGFYWNVTDEEGRTVIYNNGEHQEGINTFFKTGGGLEFILGKHVSLNIGGTFRYSLTERLDQLWEGDENDGILDFYGGLTYYFNTSSRGDRDSDGVPDELDLALTVPEDEDGFMDHDGKPDGLPPLSSVWEAEGEGGENKDIVPPVVIHSPVRKVEEGQSVPIEAEIFENRKLRVASVLYRTRGFDNWKVLKLKNLGGVLYQGVIPGNSVRRAGLEYCVVAVDEAISGVGYSGLPRRPIRVEVLGHPMAWRILGGAAAILGWGSASYLILKKQK